MTLYGTFDYQTSFKPIGLEVQEKAFNIVFNKAAILDLQF